jgi:hypothetical protein
MNHEVQQLRHLGLEFQGFLLGIDTHTAIILLLVTGLLSLRRHADLSK